MNMMRRWMVVAGAAGLVVVAGGVAEADDWVDLPPLDGELCESRAVAAAAAGFNVILGGPAADVLNGGGGRDLILGLGGNDLIDGGGGNDLILSGDGNDIVRGNTGDDTLCLGAGDDFGYGNPNDDRIFGEAGFDHGDGGLGIDGCAPDVEVQVSC